MATKRTDSVARLTVAFGLAATADMLGTCIAAIQRHIAKRSKLRRTRTRLAKKLVRYKTRNPEAA